ncbi:MAG: YaeQ family protein [Aliarcobacter sp.]|nr:YaeQ family protein [Aliarcobacter sp.]
MATKATIYKAFLNIANMDTNYYNEHSFTLALHPSETHLRLMSRIIAFILNAHDDLVFCKGISESDEPDLWDNFFNDDIKLWIDLGQVDEKRIKKACGRSEKVIVYTYQENMSTPWFAQIENNLTRFNNLSVIHLNIDEDIEDFVERSMSIQCNISDGELTLIQGNKSITITQNVLKQ